MNNPHKIYQASEFVIAPPRGLSLNLKELWEYRELFYFFTLRDIKVKYKQTILGILWVLLQPLLTVLIFSLFFGKALNVPSENVAYPVFVFSGLLLWNVFAAGITNAGNSMVNNAQIIKKIYFPRLIIPISSILVSVFDFMVSFIVFAGLLAYYRVEVDLSQMILLWPIAVAATVVGTLGLSCWLAALNVKYRDFRYLIPFFIQAFLFLTPVIYPISVIKTPWLQYLLAVNPMYGAITLFRLPIVHTDADITMILISLCSSTLLIITGIFYFRRTEAFFADIA